MVWTRWKAPKTWIVVALTALLVSVVGEQRAEACSCLPSTVESSYNNSTDVAMVQVNAGFRWGSTRWYLGTVQKPFKGCLSDGEPLLIRTAASSAACGTTFAVGESYLINGYDDGSLLGIPIVSTNLCSYNLEVEDLTADDLDFLFGRNVCCGDDCACADGSNPVACFVNPCDVAGECPDGDCVANYCGGCNAEFYDESGYAVCESSSTSECASDADCPSDEWCRQADPGAAEPPVEVYECVPFVGAGDSCNGFTLPWIFERCAEGLVCDPVEPTGDLPGVCSVPCAADADCAANEHCSDGLCAADADTGCYSDADCAAGFACNAAEVCLPPPGCTPGEPCPTVCYGQCVAPDRVACSSDADCIVTGCSSQVCAAEDVITTCEWREEYACYAPDYTSCGCQQGACGWEQTFELEQCLIEAGANPPLSLE